MVTIPGHAFDQKAGKYAVTAVSKLIPESGLFVEFHQTSTTENDAPFHERNPLVFFAQNAGPCDDESWYSQVLELLSNTSSSGDSVLLGWGLGFLLYERRHPDYKPELDLHQGALDACFKLVLLPVIEQILSLGPGRFHKPTVCNEDVEDSLVFPADLYNGLAYSDEHFMFHPEKLVSGSTP